MTPTPLQDDPQPLIRVRNLGRRFKRRWACRHVDLDVPPGSVTALLGRNGVGKSTTIRCLLGLLAPTEGDVSVLGHDPATRGRQLFHDVAYVSERRELLDDLSVAQLADFVAHTHGPRFQRDAFDDRRKRYRLDPSTPCAVLSKGQRARLLLALSLAADPKVLVLDEPTSGLDVLVRDDFLEALADFAARPDRAVLLSSHLIEDIARICDRAVILRPDKPALSGDLEDLRARCSRYVAFLDGVVPSQLDLQLPDDAVVTDADPRAITIVAHGPPEHLEAALDERLPLTKLERRPATLKEAFTCLTHDPREAL